MSGQSATGAPAADPRRAGRLGLDLWHTLRDFLTRVFVEPVRSGRLRDTGWPSGLRPVVLAALIAEGAGILLVLLAGPIRASLELTATGGSDGFLFPRAALWIVTALTAFALTLGQAGALHAPPWLRWLVTGFIVLVIIAAGSADGTELQIARALSLVSSTGLVLFTALRGGRRRHFAWWELLVTGVLVWGSLVGILGVLIGSSRSFGIDSGPLQVGFVITLIGQLALPAAIAAGSAVAELAVSTANWAATAIRDNLGRLALAVLLVALVVWRLADLGIDLATALDEPGELLRALAWALAFLLVVVGLWLLLRRLRPAPAEPGTAEMLDEIGGIALPIAAATMATVLLIMLATTLQFVLYSFGVPAGVVAPLSAVPDLLGRITVLDALRIAVGIGVVAVAAVLARRGRRSLPELLAATGASWATLGVADLLGFGLDRAADGLALLGGSAAIALLLWYLLRRRLTVGRMTALAIALLVSAMFAHRDFISDPLAALLGGGALAVVLVGLVWAQLTGYQAANDDSERYPRPTRVLLALGNSLFAISMLAYTALARDDTAGVDLADFAWVGSTTFGNALIAGALLISLRAAVRARD